MDIITSLNVPCSHYHIADKLLIKRVINFSLKKKTICLCMGNSYILFYFLFLCKFDMDIFSTSYSPNHEEWWRKTYVFVSKPTFKVDTLDLNDTIHTWFNEVDYTPIINLVICFKKPVYKWCFTTLCKVCFASGSFSNLVFYLKSMVRQK